MIGYKIVEIINGVPYSLFHGNYGSREIPVNEPVTADIKLVDDGGKKYMSGWHFFCDKEIAKRYIKKYKKLDDRYLIECFFYGVREKETNQDVLLAKEIYIPCGWFDNKISLVDLMRDFG